jgi:hypothetical protein
MQECLRRRTSLWVTFVLLVFFTYRAEAVAANADQWLAKQHSRKTIYHSPQKPGYTCWVGAWIMSDKSLMVTFDQATGAMEGRPRAPQEVLDANSWLKTNPQRDFTGLKLANMYLRSTDGGTVWTATESSFSGPFDRPVFNGSHIGLRDGAILRALDGSQLPLDRDLPRRVFFQRSFDLGKRWGKPEVPPAPKRPVDGFLGDYGDGITRIRRLRNDQLIAIGSEVLEAFHRRPSGRLTNEPFVMTSPDEGQSWTPHYFLTPEHRSPGSWNEWDIAELPNGDLLGVVRRTDPHHPRKQVRWQALLQKQGPTWILKEYAPSSLEHSGHPELLPVKEGILLHIATEGIHWTADAGQTWTPVIFPDLPASYRPAKASQSLRTRYYPRSFQIEDGTIYIFSHHGWDNDYGEFDQSIVMDTFRLELNSAKPSNGE